jgi:hypothetical protein
MDLGQFIVSIISGGLAGGSVSTFANRRYYLRSLRTKFYPKVNNILAAYVIRLEDPDNRLLIQKPGHLPAGEDLKFVDHRSDFIHGLVEFNELDEARELRKKLVDSMFSGVVVVNEREKTKDNAIDLMQEYRAIEHCHDVLHKRLKLG